MDQKIVLKTRKVVYEDTFKTFESEDYELYIMTLGDFLYEQLDHDDHKFDFYFDNIKETSTFSSTLDHLEKEYGRYFMKMFVAYVVLFLLRWDEVSDIILGLDNYNISPIYSNFVLYCNQRHISCGNMYDFIKKTFLNNALPSYKNTKENAKKTEEKCTVFLEEQEGEYKHYIKNFEND